MDFYDDCLAFNLSSQPASLWELAAINLKSVAQPQINQCKIREQTHSRFAVKSNCQSADAARERGCFYCGWGPGPGYSIFIVCQFSWNRINQMPSDILRLIINST